jgi:hypothetical protein
LILKMIIPSAGSFAGEKGRGAGIGRFDRLNPILVS